MAVAGGNRRLGSWIDSFLEYTEILPSPPLMRKWAAISFVAAAMERKIWVRTYGSNLYPHLYVLLVGPPGVGKGVALGAGEDIVREVTELQVGPTDMTAASLIDALNASVRRLVLRGPEPVVEFNSMMVISRELGVLIPAWETSLMNNLTDIWDGRPVDQQRRGKDLRIKILAPQINLLGATTPSYLNEVMPAGAWDQGFISRTIMVYSGDRTQPNPFAEEDTGGLLGRLRGDLLHDLKSIANEYGQMGFTRPAAAAIQAWIKAGQPPEPSHLKLQHYNSRRLTMLLKLCMIVSMSKRTSRVIELDDYATALNLLIEVEAQMAEIFKSMKAGGDSDAMEECWNFVWTVFAKENKAIAQGRVVNFLRERIPAHSIMRVIDIMVQSGMFELEVKDGQFVGYKPASRQTRMEGRQ